MSNLCQSPVRGGGTCTLDQDHRGHHSTVTYRCDGCGRARRGQPHATGPDGEHDNGLRFCFMCSAEQIINPHGLSWEDR
jgi:hypothetical protein